MTDVNIIGTDGNDSSFMQIQTLQVSVAVRSLSAHLHTEFFVIFLRHPRRFMG
jgi:hypothetical protein